MGDVHNRGTRTNPLWYCRYIDLDGKRKHRPTYQPTKSLAVRFVAEVEARIARGLVGIPERRSFERQGRKLALAALATQFLSDGESGLLRRIRSEPEAKPLELQRAAPTLAALTKRFLREAHPRSKNPERYRSWLRYTMDRHVLPDLGRLPSNAIRPYQVEAVRDGKLSDGYAAATVNSMLKALSVVLTWAAKRGLCPQVNPTRGLRLRSPSGLVDYLSHDEVRRLLTHTREHSPDTYPMLAMAIYTGMRKGELFGLRWADIVLERKIIHVMRSYSGTPKSGRWRPVPLHSELEPILRDWQLRCPSNALVFPVRSKRLSRTRMGTPDDMLRLDDLMKDSGCHIPMRPWHALRHTFASHYVMAGGNLFALQKILGHSKFEMTQVYSHLAPDFMASEMSRLTFSIPSAQPIGQV